MPRVVLYNASMNGRFEFSQEAIAEYRRRGGEFDGELGGEFDHILRYDPVMNH